MTAPATHDTLATAAIGEGSDGRSTAITLIGLLLVTAVMAGASMVLQIGALRFMTDFLLYLSLATVWNLLAGYGGLVSVGQQAYVGLGAYAFVVAFSFWGLPLPVAIIFGAAVALVAGLVFSSLVLRMAGPHFAIGTWVMAELCLLVVANWPYLGGGSGLSIPASIVRQISPDRAVREVIIYLYALGVTAVAIGGTYLLLRSKWGLALTAMRDAPRAAESLGINARLIRIMVSVFCAALAGAVGGLIFLSKLRMTPDSAFSLIDWTAYVIFIVIIGGIRRIEGPIIGTIVFFTLRGFLAQSGPYYLIVLGVLAVAVMVMAPDGLWGLFARRFKVEIFSLTRQAPVRRTIETPKE